MRYSMHKISNAAICKKVYFVHLGTVCNYKAVFLGGDFASWLRTLTEDISQCLKGFFAVTPMGRAWDTNTQYWKWRSVFPNWHRNV